MKFWKMNGAGNDFVILDATKEDIDENLAPVLSKTLCERHLSIGADGFMLVLPTERMEQLCGKQNTGADYGMFFFNSDGSMGEMCGNGARCICRYGYETGLSGEIQTILTTAGIVTGKRIDRRNYKIRLNDPSIAETGRTLSVDGTGFDTSYVELGNPGIPHLVLELPKEYGAFADDFLSGNFSSETGLRELGRALRKHEALPKGANVNFYRMTGDDSADIVTFERGVEDFTYACGTGTGSTALILKKKGLISGDSVMIRNRGGVLKVTLSDGIYLTGPTNIVAKGEVTDEELDI